MVDEKATPTRGIKDVVKGEFSKFLKDPLFYAIDRWIGCFLLALAISIIASGVRMLVTAGMSVVQ